MKKQAGFTLIEIIAGLVIAGMLAAVAGMGIVQVVRGYTTTRENARVTQQAQLVIARITREIIDLVDIPSTSTATSLFIKQINGNSSLGLDSTDNTNLKIRIHDTGGAISSGDILIEGVNAFTLTYWAGDPAQSSTTWTPGTDDIQQLKFIDVNLRLDIQSGGYLEFANRVAPRNNKGAGGTAPTSQPPTAPNYGCFIATACFGSADHPAVIVLRDFRDRFLGSWKGGRFLVRCYYSHSPHLAEKIRQDPIAMMFTRAILFPLIVFALFMLYAPLTLASLLFITPLCLKMLIRRRRLKTASLSIPGSGGMILVTLLMTMLIMSVLSAAILPIFSSSEFSQVYADQGSKAYFLAESGFRYAASVYLNAADDAAKFTALSNLNRKTCTLLDNDGSFSLLVYPYWYRTSVATASDLTVQLAGEFDPAASLPSTGYLKVDNTYYTYSGSSGGTSGSTALAFTGITPALTGVTSGRDVYNVVLPSATQTVTQKGSMTVGATGVSILPLINGNFTLDPAPPGTTSNTVYTYEKRSGNTLSGIDLADTSKPWTNLSLTSGAITNANATKIVLSKYLRLPSTGTYGGNSREIIYNVPIGWAKGTQFEKSQYLNTFTGADGSAPAKFFTTGNLGGHEIQSNALKITGTAQMAAWSSSPLAPIKAAQINFNWGNTDTNLGQAWMDSNGTLTYDVQVKVQDNPKQDGRYAIGILTRSQSVVVGGNNDWQCYGISFMRAQRYNSWLLGTVSELIDKIADGIKPGGCCDSGGIWQQALPAVWNYQYSQPAIVLWQRTNGTFNWLAYKLITYDAGSQNYIVNSSNQLSVNWPTLMVRMVERFSLSFTNGSNDGTGRHIQEGDVIKGVSSNATALVNGTPMVSAGDWSSADAQGTLTIANVSGTFQASENISIGGQGTTVYARTASALGKNNYIRVYYADTTEHLNNGAADAIQTNNIRLANPAGIANWPPDDAADASAVNDYFTLVQWTEVNTSVAALLTSTVEPSAIIGSNAITSPAWTQTSSPSDLAETVSLNAFGANVENIFSYDDFAIQVDLKSGSGFLPPIQQ